MNLHVKNYITQPTPIALIFSILALLIAFFLQFVLDLQPCYLCMLQRYGFAMITFISLFGLIFYNKNIIPILLCFLSLYILTISFWHIGVELQWWAASLECSGMTENIGSLKEELKKALNSPAIASCDQASPKTFGITIVQWSFIYGLVLFITLTILTIKQIKDKK
jgi:disulfide bond formation protein DsbB